MKKTAMILVAALMGSFLAGCGSSAKGTTCSQYAQMDPNTGLFTMISAEQLAVVQELLEANGMDSGNGLYVGEEHLKIIAYCNIYGGASGGNGEKLISDVFR